MRDILFHRMRGLNRPEERLEERPRAIPVGLLPPPEDNLDAHLVPVAQKLLRPFLSELPVMVVRPEPDTHPLDVHPLLVLPLFLFSLCDLIPVLPNVEDFAHRRVGGGDLDKIQSRKPRLAERFFDWDDTHLLSVGTNEPHRSRADARVHAEAVTRTRGNLWRMKGEPCPQCTAGRGPRARGAAAWYTSVRVMTKSSLAVLVVLLVLFLLGVLLVRTQTASRGAPYAYTPPPVSE